MERGLLRPLLLTTTRFFEGRAKNLVLSVGAERSTVYRHVSGDLNSVHFLLPRRAFDRLAQRAAVRVDYGAGSALAWDFGTLDKRRLAP